MNDGYERLWSWFGLSYASWLTIPRVLMHDMPDEWQEKMAELLEEYDDAFPNQPDISTRVQAVDVHTNKFTRFPSWICNYRRPDQDEINKMRGKS